MAAYAAHLTRTLQGTPSVFQVTAQEALGATVKPALRKVIEYLGTVYPNKWGWCIQWFDELYLLFDFCLQYHYLKNYAASFSERFYGLLRVPTGSIQYDPGQRLPVTLEQSSLVLLVLAPYIKDKIEGLVEQWRADDDDGLLGKSKKDQARRAAIHVYSVAHLCWSGARVAQLARYVSGAAPAHAPALAALGLALRDAPAAPAHTPCRDWMHSLKMGDYRSAVESLPSAGEAALRVAEYGAFLVQAARWWHGAAPRAPPALPPPPPPHKDEKAIRMKNRCPICFQSWKVPTALPVSGYIFCYVCISRHVRAHGACPVSRAPAAEAALVRLYLD